MQQILFVIGCFVHFSFANGISVRVKHIKEKEKENGSSTDGLATIRCEADVRQKPRASGSCHLCSFSPSDIVALTLRIKLSASIGKQKVPEEMQCTGCLSCYWGVCLAQGLVETTRKVPKCVMPPLSLNDSFGAFRGDECLLLR